MDNIKYTLPDRKLKELGYTFQKLYANDYRTYTKTICSYKLRLWSSGKSIEINDWHNHTANIIEFYKTHRDNIENTKYLDGSINDSIKIQLNPETGFIQLYDFDEYYKVFKNGNTNPWEAWIEKYGKWNNEIYLFKSKMDEVIKEIEILTK